MTDCVWNLMCDICTDELSNRCTCEYYLSVFSDEGVETLASYKREANKALESLIPRWREIMKAKGAKNKDVVD